MKYDEAREWLEQVSKKGNELGLERMRALMRELGDPQQGMKFVHIAGTNGKGSIMTYLERTLHLAGYRVGRYLSPALFCYEEKIRVDEKYIPKEEVAALVDILREACKRMNASGQETPTIFEVETALAFLYFKRQDCDLVLLETGMGGATDATNVVGDTILEIFSSISLDHTEFLGNTVEEIAGVKAGILKKGSLAVSDAQLPGVEAVLRERASALAIPIRFVEKERITDVRYDLVRQSFTYLSEDKEGEEKEKERLTGSAADGEEAGSCEKDVVWRAGSHEGIVISMPGTWQIQNACVALEAVDALRALGYRLDEETVRQGFAEARLEGRFELIHTTPTVIMDGAHNPEAAMRLRESILAYFPEYIRKMQSELPLAESDRGMQKGIEAERTQLTSEITDEDHARTGRIFYVMGVFSDKDYTEEIALTAPLAEKIFTVQTKDNPRALEAEALAEAVRKVNPHVVSVGDVGKALDMVLAEAKKGDVIILFGSLSWLVEAREYFNSLM